MKISAVKRLTFAGLLIILLASVGRLPAVAEPADPIEHFEKSSAMVPMRDGTRLYTEIYVPRHAEGKLPILLWRSPYNVAGVGATSPGGSIFANGLRELAEDGYIFVFQDIRGRHQSEGEFVMIRPARDRSLPGAIDESTDAHDSIEWLLEHLPGHNGRVGMLGVSYPGWLAVMAAIDPHPALQAVSPQGTPADLYLGDDFFHNGAFHLSYGFEYVAFMERSTGEDVFDFGEYDTYSWYRDLGGLSQVLPEVEGFDTSWDDFVAHPSYDEFWQQRAVPPQIHAPTIPNLTVGGWYDAEDGYGPYQIYRRWRDEGGPGYLVLGPWKHGGWLSGAGRTLGPIDFGSDSATHFRNRILVPWFAHYLKGRGQPPARVNVFETGANRWRSFDSWPEDEAGTRKLYLRADGRLSFQPPTETEPTAADHYLSDPKSPVPYRRRPIESMFAGPGWSEWLVQDQRFVDSRPDVVSWVSEPLEDDLLLSGEVKAHLYASTSNTDADWVVKLIDVYPGDYPGDPALSGYQFMVAGEILRGRYRDGFREPRPITPGKVEGYRFSLHYRQHRFRKGHRLMVQVQSSWFPLFDLNPQSFVENIFRATDTDFQAAKHSVYRSKSYPSHLELTISE